MLFGSFVVRRNGTRTPRGKTRLILAVFVGMLCFAAGGGADTYQEWKTRVFSEAEQADPAVSGETALSPAGDGIPNLLKYAFGIDPHISGSFLLPSISLVTVADPVTGTPSQYPAISYQTSSSNPPVDLYFVPEISLDLVSWVRGDLVFTAASFSNGVNPGDPDTTRVVAASSLAGTPTSFLRLLGGD